MKILEFVHVAPFDGCFHRWEYLAVIAEEVYPIVFTPGHLEPHQIVEGGPAVFFEKFRWFEWNQELFDEIPYGYFPAFWAFAQEHDLEFLWKCDECGLLQEGPPLEMSSYCGNGGVGIEAGGWLCPECGGR